MPSERAVSGSERLDSAILDLLPALRAFARSFERNPTDADDLVQDTLTKAIASIHQYEPGTRIKSWLFTIMRNTFNTKYKQRIRESPGLKDCASGRAYTADTQEWSVRGMELQNALNKVPPDQREVLVLVGILGTSYEEAATICGCAMGTVKSRLNRGRHSLLIALGEDSIQSAVAGNTQIRTGFLST